MGLVSSAASTEMPSTYCRLTDKTWMRLKERREKQSRRLPDSTPGDSSEKPASPIASLALSDNDELQNDYKR